MFTRITLSFNLKAILLLTLLLSNIFVSANETIKLQKTLNRLERRLSSHKSHSASTKTKAKSTKISTRRTSNKTKGLDFKQNFKAFLIGFLAVVAVKALKTQEGIIMEAITTAVDWCFEATINEYETIKKQIVSKSPCNPEIIKDLLGKENDEIQSKCAELETMRKADSNEYSSLNVLLSSVSGIFTDNSEFEKKYKEFKVEKEKLDTLNTKWTEKYKDVFEKRKNDKTGTPKHVRKVARTLYKSMKGLIFKKDLCEAVRECEAFGPLDNLKVTLGTSVGMLKCAATAQIKNPLWYGLQAVVQSIFDMIGVGFLTTLAAGIFPGVLLGLLVKFVISNWSAMRQFVHSFFTLKSDDPSTWNAERDLWNSIGRLIAGLLFSLIGARRRKLKKFRKFNERLF